MFSILKTVLLSVLLLGNLFLAGVSVHYWRTSKEAVSKTGFSFMAILEIANIVVVGGAIW